MPERSPLRYSLANIGLQSVIAFTMGFVPAALERQGARPLLIGLTLALAPLCLLLIQPLVARHSDASQGPWRRWGYIEVGAAVSAAGFLLFGRAEGLAGLILAYGLMWAGFSMARGPYMAELAEGFPPERHGAVSGIQTLMGGGATLLVFFFGPDLEALGLRWLGDVTGAVVLLSAWLAVAPERHAARAPSQPLRLNRPLRRFFAGMITLWIGLHAVLLFLVPFVVHSLMGIDDVTSEGGRAATREAVRLLGWTSLTAMAAAFPIGRLADRWGRLRVLFIGLGVLAAAMIVGGLGEGAATMRIVAPLAGIGIASVQVIPFTLMPRLHPLGRTARAAALYTLATELPRLLASPLGGGLIEWAGGYRVIALLGLAGIGGAALLFAGLAPRLKGASAAGLQAVVRPDPEAPKP